MKPLRVPYKEVNGVGIPLDIYTPDVKVKTANGLSPVLIMIHGGGFVLGFSKMNNADQIEDCLNRGWIVLCIEYRLCPGVNLLDGPICDVRDALRWVQARGLCQTLKDVSSPIYADLDRIMAMGASAGGHLALSMAWGVERPPIAILDFYGPTNFNDQFWIQPIEEVRSKLPAVLPDSVFEPLYKQATVFIGGRSLEGQADVETQSGPLQVSLDQRRREFALQAVAEGRVLHSIWPAFPKHLDLVDPVLNIHPKWPPTAIVHGNCDYMVPIHLSKRFYSALKAQNIETEFIEVEGEPHTFIGEMVKGSPTWDRQRKGFDFLEKIIKRSYV
ncbi:alpha/beta hydrolase fold-3 [Aspergillus terreus]|uniref:Alpha/beta hydrolase fold-3 n=1 Tax=Aspergillus terreus TaxID=33178 RepID=A0A5M3YTE1_ASPTE|nr:hypothetical protein ATETN484_0002065000 [Aspergillus terreus]GFF15506.1 alpha/beta hydrolase fold-3 [Aspergillus terreus]